MENRGLYKCTAQVRKALPGCEHTAAIPCFRDPGTVQCQAPCGGTLTCCTHACKSSCARCQSVTRQRNGQLLRRIVRAHRVAHPCERMLYCEHQCGLDCHLKEEPCNASCKGKCRQECVHHKCPKACSEPCAPCMEPCPWICAHTTCPVLCGSVSPGLNSWNGAISNILPRYAPASHVMNHATTSSSAVTRALPVSHGPLITMFPTSNFKQYAENPAKFKSVLCVSHPRKRPTSSISSCNVGSKKST